MNYNGKEAYQGTIVTNYDADRTTETIWQKEQNWVYNFLSKIPDKAKILDLPVGTGRFLGLYAQKDLIVYGFDISADMVAFSQKNYDDLKENHANITFRVEDAEKIGLANNSIDYIICFRLFHLIPFKIIKSILKEFYRVSNKEVVIEIFNSSLAPKQKFNFLYLLRRAVHILKKPFKKPAQQQDTKAWYHIDNYVYDYDKLYQQFFKAGFSTVKVEHILDLENPVTIFTLIK